MLEFGEISEFHDFREPVRHRDKQAVHHELDSDKIFEVADCLVEDVDGLLSNDLLSDEVELKIFELRYFLEGFVQALEVEVVLRESTEFQPEGFQVLQVPDAAQKFQADPLVVGDV